MLFNKFRERMKATFNKNNIMNFLDKQGFYIVLFICISIIGVTVYLTSGRGVEPQSDADGDKLPLEELADDEDLLTDASKKDGESLEDINIEVKDIITDSDEVQDKEQKPEDKPDSNSSKKPVENTDDKLVKEDKEKAENSKSVTDNKDNNKDNKENIAEKEDKDAAAKPVVSQQKAAKFTIIYPLEGELIRQYSMDELLYSRTLKEWTTHSGIDIESFLGAEVKAAADGTVEKVEEDPLMGIMITIDHGNGIKTRYANLSTANMVTEGQNVKAGQIISGVGRTAGYEILDPPHLHFELLINGKAVDPAEYLMK